MFNVLIFNAQLSIVNIQYSIFDVQALVIIAVVQVKSHFSGANVFHHYHGVSISNEALRGKPQGIGP
jgi:hypothetical protein